MLTQRRRQSRTGQVLGIALIVAGCGGGGGGNNASGPGTGAEPWLIPVGEVVDGGPGQDGIPAIEQPAFESASTISSVADDELVVVVRDDGRVKAYPHDILNWHEVVNDGRAENPFTVSYCPLTGSAVAWKGDADNNRNTYGVSGLLYNSNLILYDRRTNSRWSQMLELAVNGERIRELPATIQALEMKFSSLRQMYPNADVLTRETGWEGSRDYDDYPYSSYRSNEALLFPVSPLDNRLHLKERVIGVRNGADSKVFQLDGFGPITQAINDQIGPLHFVAVGNTDLNFAAIYDRQLEDGTILAFSPLHADLPNIMTDDEGNVWDIFGTATAGPRAGTQLGKTNSYTAFWFAWAAFFPDPQIHFN